jgi:hypothetical protein
MEPSQVLLVKMPVTATALFLGNIKLKETWLFVVVMAKELSNCHWQNVN